MGPLLTKKFFIFSEFSKALGLKILKFHHLVYHMIERSVSVSQNWLQHLQKMLVMLQSDNLYHLSTFCATDNSSVITIRNLGQFQSSSTHVFLHLHTHFARHSLGNTRPTCTGRPTCDVYVVVSQWNHIDPLVLMVVDVFKTSQPMIKITLLEYFVPRFSPEEQAKQ